MAEMAHIPTFAPYDQEVALSVPSPVDLDAKNRHPIEDANVRDRDSGVFFEHEDVPLTPPSRFPSTCLKQSPSFKSPLLDRNDSSARRLRRPAELNLGTTPDPTKPKSELELRYDLIRSSQNRCKAALRSPTQLLHDRLNLSPKKEKHERVHIFTPPKPMLNGCILPGPIAQMEAFTGWSVRGHTEKGDRPTWWCKFDKVVVFDGVEDIEGAEMRYKIRTSKGLTVARRRGDTETVVIPMNCAHCQDMLNRTEWKYDVQVCKRTVCWDCKERCKWEMKQEKEKSKDVAEGQDMEKGDAKRIRADSVLQDEQVRDEDLMSKIGIEPAPKEPLEIVGSIEGRLEHRESPLLAG